MFMSLVACIGTNAQKYVPFPTENAKWNVFYASSWYFSPMDTTLLQYSLKGGDTIINEKTYHKFCQNIGTKDNPVYRGIGGIREQDRKIYYCGPPYTLNHNAQGDDFEYLLYDFSKQIGDTVRMNEHRKYVITEIDSIKVGNQYRKRYQISGPYMLNNFDYIIEGIGSVKAGLLGSITDIPTCVGCQYEWNFVCFSQNGETVYLNPAFVDCNSLHMTSMPDSKASNQFVRIYPNPAINKLTIDFVQFAYGEIQIALYDIMGKQVAWEVKSKNQTMEIDVNSLIEGIYFVKIYSDNNLVNVLKFVKN